MVMEGLVAIQGDAHQEPVLPQKCRPVLVQNHPVGLYGIVDRQSPDIEGRHLFHHSAEKIQTGQGGLAPLEG